MYFWGQFFSLLTTYDLVDCPFSYAKESYLILYIIIIKNDKK